MGTDEEVVAALVSARAEALVRGDADRMREILAPDFTYTNASGVSCDREEYVDAAVVTLDVHDRATWRGEPFEGDFRSLFVYVRRGGAWRCVAGQTTARSSDTF